MNVLGFDDGPFERDHRGKVLLVGVICSGTRVDGVVTGHVHRDGADATRTMSALVRGSQFAKHLQAVLLQGIAVGGFNVVDVHALHAELGVPVIVIVRKSPDMAGVRRALFSADPRGRPSVTGAARKWSLIERAGAIEPLTPSRRSIRRAGATGRPKAPPRVWIQRAGISMEHARDLIESSTLHGNIPEPLRIAHLIAGALVTGRSRGRA